MRSRLSLFATGLFVVGCGSTLPFALRSSGGAEARLSSTAPLAAAGNAYISASVAPAAAPAVELLGEAEEATVAAKSARELRVESALMSLARHVTEQSHPDALLYAFQAYFSYREANPEQVRKPYLYFVDYGLGNRTPRGYVFDMEALTLVEGPFTVAHGRGSSSGSDGAPTRFSNKEGSAATSLGLYLAQETYGFSGTSNGSHYRSIGLRLRGLSGRFNSAARKRGVVVHGAPYVTAARAGRSEGCPAMEQSRAERLIPKIANGGMVFLFSSRDTAWMRHEPWAQGISGPVIPNG